MVRGIHTRLSSMSKEHIDSEDHTNSPLSITTSSSGKRRRGEDFDALDPVVKLVISLGPNKTILPSNECAEKMRSLFLSHYDTEGYGWKRVTHATKDFYWAEFKKTTTHPGFREDKVYKAYLKKIRRRYSDWMCEMRSNNVTCPEGMDPVKWNSWAKYWKTEEFKKKSLRGKNVRHRNGKGMVNHTGGSQTFAVHSERLELALGMKPDPAYLHQKLHMYKKKPGVYCDNKAKEMQVDYEREVGKRLAKRQSEAELSGSEVPTDLSAEEKNEIYKEVAGGLKKGHQLYGVGSAVSQIYPKKSKFIQGASTEKVVELEGELQNCKLELAREKEERKREMDNLKEQNKKEMADMKEQNKIEMVEFKKWIIANMQL